MKQMLKQLKVEHGMYGLYTIENTSLVLLLVLLLAL